MARPIDPNSRTRRALALVAQGVPQVRAAEICGLSLPTLRTAIRRAREQGDPTVPKSIQDGSRASVIRDLRRQGLSMSGIAARLGIYKSVVRKVIGKEETAHG